MSQNLKQGHGNYVENEIYSTTFPAVITYRGIYNNRKQMGFRVCFLIEVWLIFIEYANPQLDIFLLLLSRIR